MHLYVVKSTIKCLLFLCFFSVKVWASENCYIQAGARYNVDPTLIYSIAGVESDHDNLAINKANSNGTADYGLMQINSIWLPHLKKHFGASVNDLFDSCYNIHVGTWILSNAFAKWGYNWKSVGAYNVGFGQSIKKDKLRSKYANKIYTRYKKYCALYGCTGNLRMY
ncbi:lytic transglycosylase domain-containing protein [Acinetobacter baumannii]|uniref:lytic transglycosylase domain-containing protein n=1 Tax=Acinetobacter baumannii TaxID=470 RepID=UPI00396D0016